jgi:serine/threonine-protein kinase
VGVLLYQMVTGRLPAGTIEDAPAALAPVLRRAMAADPRDRFASAADLRAALQGRAPSAAPALPPEEESWQRAVALALAGATAIALYALLVSLTPRTLDPGDSLPFIALGAERLADGRVFTRARFETWPTLAAAAAFAVAFAAYGLLRRHWRHAGLEVATPDRPLGTTRTLLRLALIIDALFAIHLAVDLTGARIIGPYIPVLGGTLELLMVYLVWRAVLEALRTGRQLRRERLLWLAVALSLLPPAVSFTRILLGRSP